MILRNYPDSISKLNNKNFIVHFTTKDSEINTHVSPLSIKCSMKGSESHKTPGGNYKVTSGKYLIINEGQDCSSQIENEAEIFSVYFDSKFANEALHTLMTPSDKLLNVSFLSSRQPVHFFEKLYLHNNTLSPTIMKLKLASKVNYDDESWMKEQFFDLLEKLLVVHRDLYKEIDKLPPIKFSTKTELYKRVCNAKEFIDSSFTSSISLETISKEACLSQYHFLRMFKSIFKITPHQYIIKKRLEKASNLLMRSDMPVTQICFEIGFESLSTFSWMFKKKFGIPPEIFRSQYNKYIYKNKIL